MRLLRIYELIFSVNTCSIFRAILDTQAEEIVVSVDSEQWLVQ